MKVDDSFFVVSSSGCEDGSLVNSDWDSSLELSSGVSQITSGEFKITSDDMESSSGNFNVGASNLHGWFTIGNFSSSESFGDFAFMELFVSNCLMVSLFSDDGVFEVI